MFSLSRRQKVGSLDRLSRPRGRRRGGGGGGGGGPVRPGCTSIAEFR